MTNRALAGAVGAAVLVVMGVVVCAAALAAGTSLTGRIVITASDAPFADDVTLVRLNGARIDLSKSPAYDAAPVVAPDGKHVAFFSLRGGRGAEYVVALDGRGLRRVTPKMDVPPSIAWSPSGSQLAVLTGGGQGGVGAIHLAAVTGGAWRLVAGVARPAALVGWSPVGGRIAYTNEAGGVVVLSLSGRKLLDLAGESGSWSPTGRLAVVRASTADVYDARGRRVASFSAVAASWSPGDRLATLTSRGVLRVRSHGVGRPSVSVHVDRAGPIRWVSPTVVQVRGALAFDVAKKHVVTLPSAFTTSSSVLPSLGVAFGEPRFATLAKAQVGGTNRVVTSYAICQGKNADAFSSVQALPDGSGAVYAGDCAPPADVFAVAPNGARLARVTHTLQDESSVTASPDGSRLAFTRTAGAQCVGCDQQLWVTNAKGG
ncbi:MAG TPA: hypothetical protein VFU51_02940, partial [Gaiellaceae bacterium]|nr:hypothetical protein [Gaiellaceae bacterium]